MMELVDMNSLGLFDINHIRSSRIYLKHNINQTVALVIALALAPQRWDRGMVGRGGEN